ncbi:hypothetical protein [Pseudoxanthomonas mexicana]|uniref:hypothetical protein n=1 Tax=Pseudoxanthomonas mexicana TaxID=128785 RepID=UPI00398A52BB
MSRSTEAQDKAAGGAKRRQLRVEDGAIVVASVSVRAFKRSKQLYGYLQFKLNNKTVTRYIGNVSSDSKLESISKGWRAVRKMRIAETNGWTWVK